MFGKRRPVDPEAGAPEALPRAEKRAIDGDKADKEATPKYLPRHRMAGSTSDGEYVTSHHRRARRRG